MACSFAGRTGQSKVRMEELGKREHCSKKKIGKTTFIVNVDTFETVVVVPDLQSKITLQFCGAR